MTATLVRHMSTTPITRTELEVRSNIRQRSEYLAGRTPGQLWERVADLDARTPLQHGNPRSNWDPLVRARYGLGECAS